MLSLANPSKKIGLKPTKGVHEASDDTTATFCVQSAGTTQLLLVQKKNKCQLKFCFRPSVITLPAAVQSHSR